VSDVVTSSGVRLCNIAIYSIILVISITTDYIGENRQSALTSCPTRSVCYNTVNYTQFLYDLDIQVGRIIICLLVILKACCTPIDRLWTKKENSFEKAKRFLPINRSFMHLSLRTKTKNVIIVIPSKYIIL